MRMTLSDLRLKDVINTRDGRSLGKVIDLEFCLCDGKITALIVPGCKRGFSCGQFLRGEKEVFETERYDTGTAAPYEEEIRQILEKRQPNAEADWKAFGEKLSGQEIPEFDVGRYQKEYRDASKEGRDETFLGRFILAALAQKSMVTNKIYKSGSLLAGYSIDYKEKGLHKGFHWK
jgi:sporulation protein YlmC with PRC-barrel domain